MQTMPVTSSKSYFFKFLNVIENAGNRLPHPWLIFFVLSFVIIGLSALFSAWGVSVTLPNVSATAEAKIVTVQNLLNWDGLLFIMNSVITNFTGFFPLGTVFFMMLCIGITEGSGLMRALMVHLVSITPQRLITVMVVFLGVSANIASSAGYVILAPLSAVIFLGFQRHPVAGIAAAFAGVSGGWSAGLLISANDAVFAGLSTEAARLIDPNYQVLPTGNWYFMAVSAILITLVGTWVTEKIVEPRLGQYHGDFMKIEALTTVERSALRYAGLGLLIYILILIVIAVPQSSIFRHPDTHLLTGGALLKNLIVWIGLAFALTGMIFGKLTARIKNSNDVAEMMIQSIQQLSGFLVLIFFAAQFIAYFNYSNLGIILAVNGAEYLQSLGLTGLPVLIGLVLITACINLLIAVDTAKWAMMAPVFVPMFMQLGLSPELTQAAYRIGDSVTNIIAPTMPFFPLIVALCQKYNPKLGIGSLAAIMLPYTLCFLGAWLLLLIIWYLTGFALGVDAGLFYSVTN